MDIQKIESFLSKLSSAFRRFFVDMRLQYDYSEDGTLVQVTLSRVSEGSGVSLVPQAIFSITGSSVRFLKLDLSSKMKFADFQVTTLLDLRVTVLYIVYELVHAERKDLGMFEFLSKIFSARIEDARGFLLYLLEINDVDHLDNEGVFIYGYGNVTFYPDAVSFYSTQSARAVYKVDTDVSIFNVICLLFDGVYAYVVSEDPELAPDPILFQGETAEEEEPPVEEADPDGLGGFGDLGGGIDDFGGAGDFGGGGGTNHIPVEGDDGTGLAPLGEA